MYYEVYVDVLFVENLWMNVLLLLLTGWAGQVSVKYWRVAAAACVGSLGACALTIASAWLSGIGYFLGTFGLAAVMVFLAFSGKKGFFGLLLSLYLESFVLNGILRYLEQFHRLFGLWFGIFGSISVLFLLAAEQLLRMWRKRKALTCPVVLRCGTCEMLVEALCDTGNSLYDPISKSPVSILSDELMKDFLSKSGRELLPRMIPYHTISESGVLQAYILDVMEIQEPSGSRTVQRPMVACMPKEPKQYQLILHRDLLSS